MHIPESIDDFTEAWLHPGGEAISYPASYSQERLWFVQQLAPDSAVYNLPAIARWRGPLDLGVLERSFNQIVQRHQTLRTSFEDIGGRLRQVVALSLGFKLRVIDMQAGPPAGREGVLQEWIAAEVARPFDLSQPPLLRATVLRLSDTDRVLVLVVHHAVADGWSLGLFARELAALYGALAANEPLPLPQLTVQFGDYAAWEREAARSDRWQKQLGWWRRQLSGASALRLTPDRPRPARRTFRGATQRLELPPELTAKLKALCRRERVTPFMLLLAAFKLLLHGYTGQTDLVVGAPVMTRSRQELEQLIGCLVNLLALRTDAAGDPTLREFVQRVRDVVLSATANQEPPFERVLEELRLKRDPGESPLLGALFTFQPGPVHLRLPGVESESISIDTATAKFDLFMEWWEAGQTLHGRLEYNTDLFVAERIAHMAIHYRLVLEMLADKPELRLSELADFIPPDPHRPPSREPGPAVETGTPAGCASPVRPQPEVSTLRTSIEERLAEVWRQVLRLPEVGRWDNFFELGGHSLLITQVIARVRAAFRVSLPLDILFDTPTVAGLAAVIEGKLFEEAETLG